MLSIQDLSQSPNKLSADYRHAGVATRVMLTGHIHQAIPDIAEQGYAEHWDCLNKYGEERWDVVFDKACQVREGFAAIIGSRAENIALAASVHDLFVRFLSTLPLKQRPRILTTDCEHPSLSRQLARLAEAGIEVVALPGSPTANIVERIASQVDDNTAAVCVSSVNFQTGHQTLELDTLLPVCQHYGAELFVDAYQSINVGSFSIDDYNLEQAFVVGGGAKYCQMGNGNCFMHVPPGRDFRPLVTGWFGCFDAIVDHTSTSAIAYAEAGACFNGSTYDAMPHFRACHVFNHFKKWGLSTDFLHDVNHYQLTVLEKGFKALDFDSDIVCLTTDVEYMGGFIAFESPYAQRLCEKIRDRGVHTDYHKNWLRMGPAPYLCDEQLEDGMQALAEAVAELQREHKISP